MPWLAPAHCCYVLNLPVAWESSRSWFILLAPANSRSPPCLISSLLAHAETDPWGTVPKKAMCQLGFYNAWKLREPKESELDLHSVWTTLPPPP